VGEAVEEVEKPAHVVTFGRQVHSKGILGGTEEAGRHIGYLTREKRGDDLVPGVLLPR